MERFAEEVTSVLISMTDRQSINKETLIICGHKNHEPPDFTSYQKSIRMGFQGD